MTTKPKKKLNKQLKLKKEVRVKPLFALYIFVDGHEVDVAMDSNAGLVIPQNIKRKIFKEIYSIIYS